MIYRICGNYTKLKFNIIEYISVQICKLWVFKTYNTVTNSYAKLSSKI